MNRKVVVEYFTEIACTGKISTEKVMREDFVLSFVFVEFMLKETYRNAILTENVYIIFLVHMPLDWLVIRRN